MADEIDNGKKCKWLDSEVELLIEQLNIPSIYEKWKAAGIKASGRSTNPSGLSKAKIYNTVIQKYLSKNDVEKTSL